MSIKSSISFNLIKKVCWGLMAPFLFGGCSGGDKPFSMAQNSDDSLVKNPPSSTGDGGGGGQEGPPAGTCVVHMIFDEPGMGLQMQISSPGSVGDIIDLQNDPVNFYPVPPISIEVNGSELTMRGSDFPSFLPYIGDADNSYDLVLHGDPKNVATGTYDSATGKAEIKGFKFLSEVYGNGDAYGFVVAKMNLIPEVTWTTNPGQVATGKGKVPEIKVDGQAFNPVDKSIIFAIGVSLPDDLDSGTDDNANGALGGAALAARFKGKLDQDPASCVEGGGIDPGNGGVPGIGPDEFKFTLTEGGVIGDKVDFGRTEVVTTVLNNNTVLDCTEAENRGGIYKTARIVNTLDQPLEITSVLGVDTDGDISDPGCAASSEFPYFNVRTKLELVDEGKVEATCEMDNFQHPVLPCTLPKDGVLRFTLAYQPFNYIPVKEGDPAIHDFGKLQITYNQGEKFNIPLEGFAEPSTKADFALAKLKQDNTPSISQVSEGGAMKVSVPKNMNMEQPFKLRLLNKGTTKWTNLKLSIVYSDDAVDADKTLTTDGMLSDMTLIPAANNVNGFVDFAVKFNPLIDNGSYDKASLKIEMEKDGVARVPALIFPLLATVGEPVLNQEVDIKLDISYIGAYIHSDAGAVFSADFRLKEEDLTEKPPRDLSFTFNDVPGSELKSVKYNPYLINNNDINYLENEGTSIYSIKKEERQELVRVFNSRGSTGNDASDEDCKKNPDDPKNHPCKKGKRLDTLDPATFCNEANKIDGAYVSEDCAYFYFKIKQEGSLGVYNPDTGTLILPDLTFEMNNPHHDLKGFAPSGPFPERHIRDTLKLALSTYLLDDVKKEDLDEQGQKKEFKLVMDDRISIADLNLADKLTTETEPPDGIAECPIPGFEKNIEKDIKNWPTVRCYVAKIEQAQYFSGKPVAYRGVDPNDPNKKIYDVVLAGVTRFSGNDDPNVPFFLKDNGGPLMYVAIHGELVVTPKP